MAGRPILYGAPYSVYVRICRLALLEKGVDHELVPIDVFAPAGLPDWYLTLHPFGRIPAFVDGDFSLHETSAICRYIDEAFDGPPLQPANAAGRAVMTQIAGLIDSYAYRPMVWDVYVERVSKPREAGASDETRIAAALPVAETCLAAIEALKRRGPFLLGDQITLADLHAAPVLAYFVRAPEGRAMLARHPALSAWWETVSARSSFLASEYDE